MVSVKKKKRPPPYGVTTRLKNRLSLLLISIVVILVVTKIMSSNVKTANKVTLQAANRIMTAAPWLIPSEQLANLYGHVLQQEEVTVGQTSIFGPQHSQQSSSITGRFYSLDERHAYMQHYGDQCLAGLFQRYMELPTLHQTEIWKWCYFYLKHGNVYLEADNVVLLQELSEIITKQQRAVGIRIEGESRIHGSLLKLPISSNLPLYMLQKLLKVPVSFLKRDLFWAQRTLYDAIHNNHDWTLYKASCLELHDGFYQPQQSSVLLQEPKVLSVQEKMMQVLKQQPHASSFTTSRLPPTHGKTTTCPVKGGYCCQVSLEDTPILLLRHPGPSIEQQQSSSDDDEDYNSVVTLEKTGLQPNDDMTLSFFDIALQNDCLDATMECHKCLKSTKRGTCRVCKESCPCYCNILCKIRPPPKPITMLYRVSPPKFKRDASRLIPRIIHQTWYEDVTPEKYPNMSRLIESWKRSGWEYYFYNDDVAGEFLQEHFPPHVREAYDALLPGAFKADLFRYCVLLIRGGVYADMDVLLESNLDEAIGPDVGFMTPQDEPGIKVGHRSCLWNGLLAVAPGHVFLAKTIEMVVNHVRNRFTSIDYDDMLCPDPALSVSHTVDTLFVCGPCILGAGINAVLHRHLQAEFEIGQVDLFENSREVHPDDPRLSIPGRTIILQQNKDDMGAHRFTLVEKSLVVAATDMPDYDDRPSHIKHYSDTHEKVGVYGLKNLYTNSQRANEEIQIVVEQTAEAIM